MLGLFFAVVLVYEDYFGDAPYISIIISVTFASIFTFMSAICGFKWERVQLSRFTVPVVLVSLVVFSWLYGAFVGLLNDVRPEYVFRNFFGLLVYLILFLFIFFNLSARNLAWILVMASFVQLIYALSSFNLEILSTFSDEYSSISDARSSYSTGYLAIFPLLTASVGRLAFCWNRYGWSFRLLFIACFFLCVFSVVVVTASKGFILALFLFILFILIRWFALRGTVFTIKSALILTTFLYFVLPFFSGSIELLFSSFTTQEAGNQIRAEQAMELFNDMTLAGNGLGSKVSSGYTRDETGYGFELTYLNLVHKLGFFAVPLFVLYLVTIFSVVKSAWLNPHSFVAMVALGCLGFLIVGIGNPVLLAPSCVVMHCTSLYITFSSGSRRML